MDNSENIKLNIDASSSQSINKMTEKYAVNAAEAIIENLMDRRGIRQELEQVDDDVMGEIKNTIANIIISNGLSALDWKNNIHYHIQKKPYFDIGLKNFLEAYLGERLKDNKKGWILINVDLFHKYNANHYGQLKSGYDGIIQTMNHIPIVYYDFKQLDFAIKINEIKQPTNEYINYKIISANDLLYYLIYDSAPIPKFI
jgi:hypothetical protein